MAANDNLGCQLTHKQFAERIRTVFDDSVEIASWYADENDYPSIETREHILAMWQDMKRASKRIDAMADALYEICEKSNDLASINIAVKALDAGR